MLPNPLVLNHTTQRIDARNVNLSGSEFNDVNLSAAIFDNVKLADATIHNANLANLRITHAHTTGMTIEGVLVSDLFAAYQSTRT